MKSKLFFVFLFVAIIFLASITGIFVQNRIVNYNNKIIFNSVVKIIVNENVVDYCNPWIVNSQKSSGTGFVIAGKRVITNAHVVRNVSSVKIKKLGISDEEYFAKVLFVSHDVDLAILGLEDESFFDDITALSFGDLPYLGDKITMYGYPVGGNTISSTNGNISRIEYMKYNDSNKKFLSCQTDAAINNGNSGGPAVYNGNIVVGIARAIKKDSNNIGYIIPTLVINQFLQDIEDGRYDGIPEVSFSSYNLDNKGLRDYLSFENEGFLINGINENSYFEGKLEENDIVISIDDYWVDNFQKIQVRKDLRLFFKYAIDKKQVGDKIKFQIIRDGQLKNIEFILSKDSKLVKKEFDLTPQYFIYGGYVFSPLTENLIEKNKYLRLVKFLNINQGEKKEIVVLVKTLNHKINNSLDLNLVIVNQVNGKKVIDFKSFIQQVEENKNDFLVVDSDELKLPIRKETAEKFGPIILKNYHIPNDRNVR